MSDPHGIADLSPDEVIANLVQSRPDIFFVNDDGDYALLPLDGEAGDRVYMPPILVNVFLTAVNVMRRERVARAAGLESLLSREGGEALTTTEDAIVLLGGEIDRLEKQVADLHQQLKEANRPKYPHKKGSWG